VALRIASARNPERRPRQKIVGSATVLGARSIKEKLELVDSGRTFLGRRLVFPLAREDRKGMNCLCPKKQNAGRELQVRGRAEWNNREPILQLHQLAFDGVRGSSITGAKRDESLQQTQNSAVEGIRICTGSVV
jgi:hypothetical protein